MSGPARQCVRSCHAGRFPDREVSTVRQVRTSAFFDTGVDGRRFNLNRNGEFVQDRPSAGLQLSALHTKADWQVHDAAISPAEEGATAGLKTHAANVLVKRQHSKGGIERGDLNICGSSLRASSWSSFNRMMFLRASTRKISAVIVDLFGPGQKLPRLANAHRT